MDLQLSGLRALVTGGTRGIGRATVEAFVAEGVSVAFCARHADAVKATQDALSVDGATVLGTPLDIADTDALTAWVTGSAELLGGIDMIVSNVSALAIEDKPENWTASFEVDLMGTVRMVNAAMPYLEASSAPSIVVVSSVSAPTRWLCAGTTCLAVVGGTNPSRIGPLLHHTRTLPICTDACDAPPII